MGDPVEEILGRFTAAGGRRTASRQAIIEAVLDAGGHMTAEQIATAVQARFPSVNLSTVYRTLEALEELRVIDHVHLGHGRAVYHLTDETHQHLFCEQCERVQELPIAKLRPLFSLLEALQPAGEGVRLPARPPALRHRRPLPGLRRAGLKDRRQAGP
jgi:Fur family transcriptional regulator, ferric uptake regulator